MLDTVTAALSAALDRHPGRLLSSVPRRKPSTVPSPQGDTMAAH
ncbi:hypothetical protein [Kitasatospora aureofaciens]|nr:hypothetical protein [Kitasatospora aureofaciens]